MPCIKCGRKLEEGQSFCPACLENAQKYPIKPGTPVQLPQRPAVLPAKPRRKKRELKPEEQIRQLRIANRWLILVLMVLLAAFVMMTALLLLMLEQKSISLPFPIGEDWLAAALQCFT